MTTKINICAEDWCNFVFEGKNKNYGAYELRQKSSKRHAFAILLSVTIFTIGVSAPVLIKSIVPEKNWKIDEAFKPVDITPAKPETPKLPDEPPVPRFRRTIQFSQPEVANNTEPQEAPPLIDNLLNTDAAISTVTQEGEDDVNLPLPNLSQIEKEPDPIRFAQQMPEFPGGEEARQKFLKDNVKYPSIAAEMGISGRVTLQFVVDKNGNIGNITVIRGIGGGCDEEAIRVVKLMPQWRPGKQNGKAVPVYFVFPIIFTLQN
ncbi:MAG TPA: TonB family protein [Bacteroidales bacterium]